MKDTAKPTTKDFLLTGLLVVYGAFAVLSPLLVLAILLVVLLRHCS